MEMSLQTWTSPASWNWRWTWAARKTSSINGLWVGSKRVRTCWGVQSCRIVAADIGSSSRALGLLEGILDGADLFGAQDAGAVVEGEHGHQAGAIVDDV